jgi:hypothetical protein
LQTTFLSFDGFDFHGNLGEYFKTQGIVRHPDYIPATDGGGDRNDQAGIFILSSFLLHYPI